MNILIVDDDQQIKTLIVDLLSSHRDDLVFYEAANGAAAARFIISEDEDNIDLVISDWQMPRMDGIGMLHNIRRRSSVPVIMMSSEIDMLLKRLEEEGMKDDIQGFVPKPLDFSVLCKLVDTLLPKDSDEKR